MDAVRTDITKLVTQELDYANKCSPQFHSIHEGYAVIAEEITELEHELNRIRKKQKKLWKGVMHDNVSKMNSTVDSIEEFAISAATEAVQVAAMCKKYKMLIGADPNFCNAKFKECDKSRCNKCKFKQQTDGKALCSLYNKFITKSEKE